MFRITAAILLAGLALVPCNAEFRDPTQPAYPVSAATENAVSSETKLVLSAIWISAQSRRATINGVSVKQGQTLIIEQDSALDPDLGDTDQLSTHRSGIASPPDLTAKDGGNPARLPGAVAAMPSYRSARIPARSNTIKIIRIYKNSVTINQNGELKTLQLVQRPYNIKHHKTPNLK